MSSKTQKQQAKVNYSFIVHIDSLKVINFDQRGTYFLYSTMGLDKDNVEISEFNSAQRADKKLQLSKAFLIEYNDQKQKAEYKRTFDFQVDLILPKDKKTPKIAYLNFFLMRVVNQTHFQYQPENSAIQIVGFYRFQIALDQKIPFIQYFVGKFCLPYAADVQGIVACIPTELKLPNAFLRQNIYFFQRYAKINRYQSFMLHKQIKCACSEYEYKIMIDSQNSSDRHSFSEKNTSKQLCEQIEINETDFLQYLSSFENTKKTENEILAEIILNFKQNQLIINKLNKNLGKSYVSLIIFKQSYEKIRDQILSNYLLKIEEINPEHQNKHTHHASNELNYYTKLLNTTKKNKTGIQKLAKSKYILHSFTSKHNFEKCPFVIHTEMKIKRDQIEEEKIMRKSSDISSQRTHEGSQILKNVYIFAHGYKGSSEGMKKVENIFKRCCQRGKYLLLKSYTQNMDKDIDLMGREAAEQIEAYIQRKKKSLSKYRIVMVGHSMGGVILRASLQYLSPETTSNLFAFVSLASPHLGYLYCQKMTTGLGLKLLDSLNSSPSIRQLSYSATSNFRDNFMYKLSMAGSLKNFRQVLLFSSIEDKYVTWNSTRIQVNFSPENCTLESRRAIEQEMVHNIFGLDNEGKGVNSKIERIHRFNVEFRNKGMSFENMIGRTAHIEFLVDEYALEIALRSCKIDILAGYMLL